MAGICGWLSPGEPVALPPDTLTTMGRALPAVSADTFTWSSSDGKFGLLVGGDRKYCHFSDKDMLVTALYGHPRWSKSAYSEVAERFGIGKSVVEAYRECGGDLLKYLRGPFSLAIIDKERDDALIAVDRMGIHPLCYARLPKRGIAFGTTVQSVGLHLGLKKNISLQSVFDYIYYCVVSSPNTIYNDIFKLQSAQYFHYKNERTDSGFYWQMPYADDNATKTEALAHDLREKLHSAVRSAVDGKNLDAVGSFLSGGLDSSTVTGLLAELAGGELKAFSIGFDVPGHDEMPYAEAAAHHFGVRHHARYITPQDVVEAIPRMARAYDEPYGNDSAVAVLCCAQLAREHGVELMLAGDGGDELFAGNSRYATQKIFEAYQILPRWMRRNVIEPAVFGFPAPASLLPVRKARSYIRRANIPLPDRLESYNFFHGIDPESVFVPEVAAEINVDHPCQIMREVYHRTASDAPVNRMMHLDMQMILADDDLRKVGRMTELAGVDVAFPMLDEELVVFSARVPARLKLPGFKLRHFYKNAFSDFLPRTTLTRPKHGLNMPFGQWLRKHRPLQELVNDSIAVLKRRDLFRPDFLDEVVSLHRVGHASYHGNLVWVLVMLEQWLQAKLVDSNAIADRAPQQVAAGPSVG